MTPDLDLERWQDAQPQTPIPQPPLTGHVHDDRCPRQYGVGVDTFLCGYRPRFVAAQRGEQR